MNRRLLRIAAWLLLSLPLIFTACIKDTNTVTYTIFTPVYKSKAEVIASIGTHPAQSISRAGKLYVYGDYIFLNDVDKGIHIINNSDPAHPRRTGFIAIPGNVDIAIRNNILYADIYSDLVAIDISEPMNARVTKVVNRVFPEREYSTNTGFMGRYLVDSTMYVVDWQKKDTTVSNDVGMYSAGCRNCDMLVYTANASPTSGTKASAVGIAGSMARFAIVNDYLYAVNVNALVPVDIRNAIAPEKRNSVMIGSGAETIYPFDNKLFIGSNTGMSIYDLTNPEAPAYQSMFSHARMCDPVITDGRYAYVTLRAGTNCSTSPNSELNVVDITDINFPTLLKSYPMVNPYGLSIDGSLLVVCDGVAGLKIYDASAPNNLQLKKTIPGIEAKDVILHNGTMIVTSEDGLVQFDYHDRDNIRQLSKIPVTGF